MEIKSTQSHKISLWVYAGTELIRHTADMRGQWDYEAKCSCGWQTHTGGAVRRYINEKIADHKLWSD